MDELNFSHRETWFNYLRFHQIIKYMNIEDLDRKYLNRAYNSI